MNMYTVCRYFKFQSPHAKWEHMWGFVHLSIFHDVYSFGWDGWKGEYGILNGS